MWLKKRFTARFSLTCPMGTRWKGVRNRWPAFPGKVEDFYRSYYVPNNAFLVIVGDLTHQEIEKELFPRLEQWPRAVFPRKK